MWWGTEVRPSPAGRSTREEGGLAGRCANAANLGATSFWPDGLCENETT